MPIFNVITAVVELIETDTPQAAIAELDRRLSGAGFETLTYDPDMRQVPHVFESEPLDEYTLSVVRDEAATWADRLSGAK